MQRDETTSAPETVEITEEPRPSISLEELVSEMPPPADAGQGAAGARRADVAREAAREEPSIATSAAPAPIAGTLPFTGLRTARIVSLQNRQATIALRGSREAVSATIAPDVDRELVEDAAAHKGSVLVEGGEDGIAWIVGIVQTQKPSEVHVTGEKIVVEGSREVLIRAGRAALRLREDGDVELVGSRISAASRGLFRIVGRILRLN